MRAGYGTFSQQPIATDIVAGGIPTTTTLTVASGTRDGGIAGGGSATKLEVGLVLGRVTTGAKYEDFDYDGSDGTQLEERCVVLMEQIEDISLGDVNAIVAVNGFFRWDRLRWRTSTPKAGSSSLSSWDVSSNASGTA